MRYKSEDFYMLRVPVFSETQLNDLFADKDKIDSKISKITDNSVFMEGIAIASPDLYQKIERTKQKNGDIAGDKKLLNSLLKYIIRAASRTTPFGLFSGFAIGNFSDNPNIILDNKEKYEKRARCDMEWVNEITKILEADKELMKKLKVFKNNGLYQRGNRMVNPYLRGEDVKAKKEIDISASIRFSKQAQEVLELCEGGIILEELHKEICRRYPLTETNVIENYILGLLNNEFIISELRMPKTNVNAIQYLIRLLQGKNTQKEMLLKLQEISGMIDQYNETTVGAGIPAFQELQSKMGETAENSNYLQVDLKVKLKKNGLDLKIKNECEEIVTNMVKISRYMDEYPYLNQYKVDFLEKYGSYTEVPLLELLDPQIGIGAPAGYTYPASDKNGGESSLCLASKNIKKFIMTKITFANTHKDRDIILTDDDIDYADKLLKKCGKKELPPSLDMNFFVFGTSEEDVKKGNYNLAIGPNVGADRAGKTLGRFADMLSDHEKEFYDSLYDKAEKQTENEYILAEIIEEPLSSRVGNIILNQNTAEYQTTIGCIGNNEKKKIELDDLLVGVDQKTNLFYIKSGKYNKRVKFTVFNMLNQFGSCNAYRFLREVSSVNDCNFIRLIDGLSMDELIYIPRIIYKKCILSPQIWKLTNHILKKPESYEVFIKYFEKWKKDWKLPRFVYQKELDNILLTDLDNPMQLEEIYRNIKQEKIISLLDFGMDEAWIRDDTGKKYQIECVMSFFREESKTHLVEVSSPLKTVSDISKNRAIMSINDSGRMLLPGTDGWWFLKLYCANRNLDTLLSEDILPFCQKYSESGVFRKFYFIKYADPQPHIRLRIQFATLEFGYPDILFPWLSDLRKNAKANDITINMYEREIERYGGAEVFEYAEKFFCLDSLYLMNLLKNRKDNLLDEQLVVMTNLDLLTSFGLDLEGQIDFFEYNFKDMKNYQKEFKPKTKEYIQMLNEPQTLWPLEKAVHDNKEQVRVLFHDRNQNLTRYVDAIQRFDADDRLTNSKNNILLSLMHMHCNRFRGDKVFELKTLELTYRALYAYRNYRKHIRKVESKGRDVV